MDRSVTSIGRYSIERLLGEGGMGAVYLARDPTIGRKLAIKVLRTDDDEVRRRFKIEVNAAGALRHGHIITIFDSGEHEGAPFLAMEYIPGETLAEKIKRQEPLPLAEKIRYIEELCDGLAHAHRAGIIHRDIKPANVIVDGDSNSVKIVDFGIARVADSAATQSGLLIGTLNYMAPEQVMGKRVDHRSDIFAAGLVLYELLSYRRAFSGGVDDGLMYRILHEELEDLKKLVPGLDDAVVAIVGRSLRKEPADRYVDAGAMAAALNAARGRLLAPTEMATVKLSEPLAPGGVDVSRRTLFVATGVVALCIVVFALWRVSRDFELVSAVRERASNTAALGSAPSAPAQSREVPDAAPSTAPSPPSPQPTTAVAALPATAASLVPPSETQLRITGPAELEATVDGRRVPLISTVRPGDHTLLVRIPGLIGARQQRFRIAAGETRTVAADTSVGSIVSGELPFPYGSVTVDGQRVSGRMRAMATSLVAEFLPETGSTAARKRVTFEVAASAERDLAALVPQARFRFEVTPAAQVTLDHHSCGSVTEGALPRVAAGDYTLKIVRRGYPDFESSLQVRAGQESVVRYAYNFADGAWVVR